MVERGEREKMREMIKQGWRERRECMRMVLSLPQFLLYYIILYDIILYYIILYYIILYCIILYYYIIVPIIH